MTTMFKDALSEIEFPAFLIERGFEDDSWHNDAAPKAVRRIGQRALVVWVSEDDPAEREMGPECKKFMVVVYQDADDWVDETSVLVRETDSAEECAAAVDGVLQEVRS